MRSRGIILETNRCRSGAVNTPRRGDNWYQQRSQEIVYHGAPVIAQQERFMFYIYGLHLEGDDEIRYVGSSCHPTKRLWQHKCGDGGNPAKDEWVAANKDRLKMMILKSDVSDKDRRKAEQRAINECKRKGYRLFNHRGAKRHAADVRDVTWWLDQLGDSEVK